MILQKTSKQLIVLILIFTLISCKQKSKHNFEKKITGEWKYIREKEKPNKDVNIPPPPPRSPLFGNLEVGYEFYNDGTFEYKFGFYKYIQEDKNEPGKSIYLGTTSDYKIDNDSLKLYNLSEKKWESYKIVDIASDTLKIIGSDGELTRFHKTNYQIDNSIAYDQLIVSSTGCYGRCPITNIQIDKSGEITYYGGDYSSNEGYYKSNISEKQFTQINLSFLKANWKNLQDEYIARHTDDEAVYVTFIKDNKIIKTIKDYGREAPTEFIWAYTPIRFLQQKIKLQKIMIKNDIFEDNFTAFKAKNEICRLTDSEAFYLKNLIVKSNLVNSTFEEKYIIEYWSNDLKKKIKTDGRFYKIENNDGKFTTYDLGYNFLEKNNLYQGFEEITKYD